MDPPKLTFLNRHHLARKIAAADEGIVSEAQRLAIARNGENEYTKDETYVKRVLDTIRERLHVLRDFENLTPYFFVEPNLSTPEAEALQDSVDPELYRPSYPCLFLALADPSVPCIGLAVEHADARLMEVPKDEFTHEAVMHALHRITEAEPRLKGKVLMTPIRHAVTGYKVHCSPVAHPCECSSRRRRTGRRWAGTHSRDVGQEEDFAQVTGCNCSGGGRRGDVPDGMVVNCTRRSREPIIRDLGLGPVTASCRRLRDV